MPPVDRTTTHYGVNCAAGANPQNPQPANPRRVRLEIQNVGANSGVFWFERQSNAGQAFVLPPLAIRVYERHCPLETVYYQSTLGTTFAVAETYTTTATNRS